jgi:dihydroorotase/N-acyl-D-amino-acid deacylase
MAERLVLAGGTVVDGTGAAGFVGDVLIEGGRIAGVGSFKEVEGAQRMDCAGMVVAPGFIDAHSHSDLQVMDGHPEKLAQGVTAEVVGNCGFSAFPAGRDRRALHEFANGIFLGDGQDWGWSGAGHYYAEAAARSRLGVESLVGHGTLRIAQVGAAQGAVGEDDRRAMERRLDECLAEGAIGFSTGLMYAPGSSAPFEELERLCRVTARRGKVYATHMRTYFGGILAAIEEQLELARRTGCRLQISHLQIAGRKNWGLQEAVIGKIEKAAAQGVDVAFDCYPYTAGSTVLTQILPQWALDGGTESLLRRLAAPVERERIAEATAVALEWAWEDVLISAVRSSENAKVVGKNIAQLAVERGRRPVDIVLDLLADERAAVNMLCFNQSEANLRATLAHPLATIISDGFYVAGRPHPRLFGTFPHFLGHYVREHGLMGLEEGVRRMTGAVAARFGMKERGVLAAGKRADVVVFDPRTIGSAATYEAPEQRPRGIRAVLVNGRAA